jgi:tetratricopeptide (TPR) repeat protein
MMKNISITIAIFLLLSATSYSAGSSSSNNNDVNKKTDYEKAVSLIDEAKKLEEKDKQKKAEKQYQKAQKLLIKSNENNPNNADTLNYLGFTTRKLGDFNLGEKYYLQGLAIEPKHNGINEYLGELYVVTNRMDLAKERLEVLRSCNCEEFQELKEIIDGTRKSKY